MSDRVVEANPGIVTAMGFMKEVDRVHIRPLELQLGAEYPNLANQQPFRIKTYGPNGFIPLSEGN